MKGFVVSDTNGLFLLNRAGELSPLAGIRPRHARHAVKAYDIPAFNGLLISAARVQRQRPASYVVVRFDDGQIVRGPTLDRQDTISKVKVTPERHDCRSAAAPDLHDGDQSAPTGAIVRGQSFEIEGERKVARRDRLEAPSIGKVLNIQRRNGIHEMQGARAKPSRCRSTRRKEPIEQAAELPESKVGLIFTSERDLYARR